MEQERVGLSDYVEPNVMEPSYLLMALGGALVCAITTEMINWFLIYRHEDYKELAAEIVDSTNKLTA